MLTLELLVKDVASKRGSLKGNKDGLSENDFLEVWGAFTRYLKSCLDQKRGLHMHNFCKIGWIASQKRAGAAIFKPFFQLTESFCRSCNMPQETIRKFCKPPAGELSPFEDFNFSKAAIKFSNGLSKDQVFSGLRAMTLRIAEAVSANQDVSIACSEVGKMVLRSDREPTFVFTEHSQEGIEIPLPATPEAERAQAADVYPRGQMAEAAGMQPLHSQADAQLLAIDTPPRRKSADRRLHSSGSAPALASPANSTITNAQFKKEVAYKEAMDRHICAMEARAAEAIAERQAWGQHMDECLSQERDEITGKRQRAQMNLHFIKHQIQMGEDRKREQRQEDIEAASSHDFPKFEQAQACDTKDFIVGQQARMRKDLDEQVRTNNTLRNLAKQRERTLEINQLQANREEMAMLRNAERAKKVYDREALATAWNSEIRMKNIWKAIENHNKVGSQHSSHPPQVLSTEGLPPPSRGGSSVASAGRLLTGNSRRAPLGASNSMSRLAEMS